MAEPVVSFVLETITKLLIEEQTFLSGVSDETGKLRSELQVMQAFLRDADTKQHNEERVKVCVSQCRDLAYEAEDVLEDYAFKLSSRRGKRGISSKVKRFACILNECLIRHKVGSEIQGLNTRISVLIQRFQGYGINALTQEEGARSRQQQLKRMTYPYVANEDDIVGIEGDIKKLVEVMVKDDFGVVSITGMGGCGKTTLARKVYNHPDVKSHFDRFAWICVSQQWKTRNILQEILVSFLPGVRHEIQDWRDGEIVEKIVRLQQEKKCLVVLDDIWTSEAWEIIKPAFPLNKKGNKILITTRNRDVATHIGPNGYHHQPRLLDDNESLELLLKKAFRNTANPELEDIEKLKQLGREMVLTCDGLPLAVVVLGGILATKHSPTQWESVSKNILSYLRKGERIQEDNSEVQQILSLSYNDLPYKLKPCFLYLSVLVEDEHIDADMLYNLWIAEGMVSGEDRMGSDESIKEVAGRYLGELAKRCIVMVEEIDDSWYGRSTTCYLHDLMKDLCRAKVREENFLKDLDMTLGHDDMELMENSFSQIPRVMINIMSSKDASKCSHVRMDFHRSLRALGIRATGPESLILQTAQLEINKFRMLRSLIIQGVVDFRFKKIGVNKQPYSYRGLKLPIGKLIHLRQLSVRQSRLFLSPSSVSNLEHLEILDLKDSRIIWTKNGEIRPRRLKYLRFPHDIAATGRIPVPTIYVPNDLEEISGELFNSSLRVKNLSGLTNVRTLGFILINSNHDGEAVEDLFDCILNSRHLREVRIFDETDKVFSQERGSILLRKLFGSNAQYISLYGNLSSCTLPLYDSHFSAGLATLILDGSYMKEDPMKILEKFPNLQNLELHEAFSGEEMVCHSTGFPQLRSLIFNSLHQLKKWMVEKGAMPNLSRLEIGYCENLTVMPQELSFISSLKELVIYDMPEEFVKCIAVNFGHVPSIVMQCTRETGNR